MKSEATTVEDYLNEIPEDRQSAMTGVREMILKNLPDGYEEVMNWGMITYQVPLSTHSDTYNKKPLMYLALASQKNHMALYLTSIYSNEHERRQFEERYKATGKKLKMGKSCLRFKKLDDLPLDFLAEIVAQTSVEQRIALAEACRKR